MVLTLAERDHGSAPILDRLNDVYAVTLLGLLIELVWPGLALRVAAFASAFDVIRCRSDAGVTDRSRQTLARVG